MGQREWLPMQCIEQFTGQILLAMEDVAAVLWDEHGSGVSRVGVGVLDNSRGRAAGAKASEVHHVFKLSSP